jgi:replicative DNA helicase
MAIDAATIMSECGNDTSKVGGVSYITNLASGVATLSGFKDWIKILLERYQLRKIKNLGTYINKSDKALPEELIAEIHQRTTEILKVGTKESQDKVTRYLDFINRIYAIKSKQVEPSYKTGFTKLDKKIGGFQKGSLVSVVSGSGIGKTTFCLNAAYQMAKSGIKVSYYTVEMKEYEFLQKLSASNLDIDLADIIQGNLNDTQISQIETFTNDLIDVPLEIVDDPQTTEELINDIMLKALSSSSEVVFIDYLQLYCGDSKGNNLSEKLGDLTITLKKIAQKNNIVIIALGQVNRMANTRVKDDDAKSFLIGEQDIQDSGRILQNSNVVLGLTRNSALDDDEKRKTLNENRLLNYNSTDLTVNPELMLVQIMKNRSGPKGIVGVRFQGKYSRVKNF